MLKKHPVFVTLFVYLCFSGFNKRNSGVLIHTAVLKISSLSTLNRRTVCCRAGFGSEQTCLTFRRGVSCCCHGSGWWSCCCVRGWDWLLLTETWWRRRTWWDWFHWDNRTEAGSPHTPDYMLAEPEWEPSVPQSPHSSHHCRTETQRAREMWLKLLTLRATWTFHYRLYLTLCIFRVNVVRDKVTDYF